MTERNAAKKKTRMGIRLATLISAVVMLLSAFTVWAWLYQGRRVAAIDEVSNPTSIYISAANKEDIRYIDLSGIDVSEGDHKDFVFCVRGDHVNNYRLQLAYTTNNQFSFSVYSAFEKDENPIPANATVVDYYTHTTSHALVQYYVTSGASPLSGIYLNKKATASDGLKLAYLDEEALYPDRNLHPDTYYTEKDENGVVSSAYGLVDKFAEPIYWQSVPVTTHMDLQSLFCDYYFLRIEWDPATAKNSKETDIIYIIARNTGLI
ncbi:MAG: hypothetical protein J5940_00785 [Clostridia bacterium]|nr:hypothetical protein [Clostridia bacterium]